jgi:hypothetical protein
MPTRAATAGRLPTQIDLTVYQGDDLFLRVTVGDATNPVDLTGVTPTAEIRLTTDNATPMATFDCSVLDATTLMLHLTHDESTAMTGNGVWDLQIVDVAGLVTTLAYGAITLIKEVTR